MQVKEYLQFEGKELEVSVLERKVKDLWKKQGKLLKDMKSLKIYIKIEEKMCYYIVNDSEKGSFRVGC